MHIIKITTIILYITIGYNHHINEITANVSADSEVTIAELVDLEPHPVLVYPNFCQPFGWPCGFAYNGCCRYPEYTCQRNVKQNTAFNATNICWPNPNTLNDGKEVDDSEVNCLDYGVKCEKTSEKRCCSGLSCFHPDPTVFNIHFCIPTPKSKNPAWVTTTTTTTKKPVVPVTNVTAPPCRLMNRRCEKGEPKCCRMDGPTRLKCRVHRNQGQFLPYCLYDWRVGCGKWVKPVVGGIAQGPYREICIAPDDICGEHPDDDPCPPRSARQIGGGKTYPFGEKDVDPLPGSSAYEWEATSASLVRNTPEEIKFSHLAYAFFYGHGERRKILRAIEGAD